jgi:hypothetical protein
MYTSPDEARSDLFLAAGVFVIGPIVLGTVLNVVPVGRIPGVDVVLQLAWPLLFTLLVPWLLMRYRREDLAAYGVRPGAGGVVTGLLVAAPLALAASVPAFLGGGVGVPPLLRADSPLVIATQLLRWAGLAGLAVYVTVKARDAFRADYRTVPEVVVQIGRVLAIVAAVASVLLLAPFGLRVFVFLVPAGAAASVLVALRMLRGPSSTSRAVLLTPVIVLALDARPVLGDAATLVLLVWRGAVLGAVGLAIAALLEGRRSALPAVGIALVLGALSGL